MRLVKWTVLAGVTFLCVWALSADLTTAGMIAAVPLLFGLLGIWESVRAGVAAISVLAFVGWFLAPADVKDAVANGASDLRQAVQQRAADANPDDKS